MGVLLSPLTNHAGGAPHRTNGPDHEQGPPRCEATLTIVKTKSHRPPSEGAPPQTDRCGCRAHDGQITIRRRRCQERLAVDSPQCFRGNQISAPALVRAIHRAQGDHREHAANCLDCCSRPCPRSRKHGSFRRAICQAPDDGLDDNSGQGRPWRSWTRRMARRAPSWLARRSRAASRLVHRTPSRLAPFSLPLPLVIGAPQRRL